jgi:hypothetical protein
MSNWHSNRSSGPEKLFDGVSIIRADRMPCPVCGHPTGDCTGDTPPPKKIAGMGGVYSDQKEVGKILVEEDIKEERQITPFYKTTVVIHRKGSYITKEEAEKFGLL